MPLPGNSTLNADLYFKFPIEHGDVISACCVCQSVPQKTAYLKRDTFEKRPIIFGLNFIAAFFVGWFLCFFSMCTSQLQLHSVEEVSTCFFPPQVEATGGLRSSQKLAVVFLTVVLCRCGFPLHKNDLSGGHLKWWCFRKGSVPKKCLNSGLGLIVICPVTVGKCGK